MSVTRSTVSLVRRLRRDIGHEADTVDRHLARQWVTAWDRIAPTMRAACTELAGIAVANDKWPSVHQIARSTALDAIEAARTELDALAPTPLLSPVPPLNASSTSTPTSKCA